ncbi:MAG: porin [Candidatus Kapabacteria bacterium]|nr:porin [Ignavibacteriota bacterium]MCW5886172.1 porin [Candidatus Kapabacteria bacterium]
MNLRLWYFIALLTAMPVFIEAQETTRSPASFDFNSNGIMFETADTSLSVIMRFRMQNRISYNTVSETDLSAKSTELAVRRLRLRFGGLLYKKLSFNLQLSFARRDWDIVDSDLPNLIRDAMVFWNFSPNIQLGIGQTKLPGNRQRVISSGDMQFTDRSIVNSIFTIDRDFGIQGLYSTKISDVGLNIRGALSNGDGRYAPQMPGANFAYTGRIEVLPFGKFSGGGDYFEGDLMREQKPKLSVGVTYSYNEKSTRTRGQLGPQLLKTVDQSVLLADAILKYRGFAFYTEYAQRNADEPFTGFLEGAPVYVYIGQGYLFQASYIFDSNIEVAVRMATVIPDEAIREFSGAEFNRQFTGSLSYYISNHRAKAQLELIHNTLENMITNSERINWTGRFNLEVGI